MPKIVDHDERRRQVIDALWRIIDREGMGGVSIRALAREAGIPRATAAYYFSGQADLLMTAMQGSIDRSSDRIRRMRLRGRGLEAYTKAFVELVPTTASRRRQSSVWLAVLAEAESDAGVREHLAEINAQVRDGVHELLTWMREDELIPPTTDLAAAADELHALVDGLALHTMTSSRQLPPAKIRGILGQRLQLLTQG